jgi:hypothetical protein
MTRSRRRLASAVAGLAVLVSRTSSAAQHPEPSPSASSWGTEIRALPVSWGFGAA